MEKSKLSALLRTFSKREWKSFTDFVRSPFFNRDAEVVLLCEYLAGEIVNGKQPERQVVYNALFPGKAYEEAHLNHLMSFLLKLAERFLGFRQMEEQPGLEAYMMLQGLSKRGLDKHYQFLFDKVMAGYESEPVRSSDYFLNRFRLESQETDRLSQSSVRGGNEYVQRAVDNLDSFYLSEKLRHTCYMLTSQKIVAVPYRLHLIDELCNLVFENQRFASIPVVEGFYRVVRMLTVEDAAEDFSALKTLLYTRADQMPKAVLEELYQYAINYCHLRIRILDDKLPYVEEALNLHVKAVDLGLLSQNGFLSPGHFKNIIKLSLIQKQYTRTEQFIVQYSQLLDPDLREDALHYNLADLYYATNRLDEAMTHLNKVEFSDLQYNLGAKVLLARIYFETASIDALESLLHALKAYLHRDRLITPETRRMYLNFVRFLSAIIRATPENKAVIRRKIEQTSQVTLKTWLLSVL